MCKIKWYGFLFGDLDVCIIYIDSNILEKKGRGQITCFQVSGPWPESILWEGVVNCKNEMHLKNIIQYNVYMYI